MIASEMSPLAKTGGLADVLGALPAAINAAGHSCSVFMPGYRSAVRYAGDKLEDLNLGFPINVGDHQITARVSRYTTPAGVAVYLIDQPRLFDRDGLYGDRQGDYLDNAVRFTFFNRAVLQAIRRLNLPLDVIHCHDWQSGLIPAYLYCGMETLPNASNAAVIMTIHNLAYQGRFWVPDYPLTGLPWDLFTHLGLEFYNDISFLKSGLVYADAVTTVSPQYALEIQTPQHGCGLEGVLRNRADELTGIVNGIDTDLWNPQTDPHLKHHFDAESFAEGKAACKRELQTSMNLPVDDDKMLIGAVGRMVSQKGWDLLLQVLPQWLDDDRLQFVFLGSGDPYYEGELQRLQQSHSHRVSFTAGFNEPLAHQIEAGCDLFLMPSYYEPCGLNQLYSLRYGTLPLVHTTGGLKDTVAGFDGKNADFPATGFSFVSYNASALTDCFSSARRIFFDDRTSWQRMMKRAMQQDWSWDASAQRYIELYYQTQQAKQNASMEQ